MEPLHSIFKISAHERKFVSFSKKATQFLQYPFNILEFIDRRDVTIIEKMLNVVAKKENAKNECQKREC